MPSTGCRRAVSIPGTRLPLLLLPACTRPASLESLPASLLHCPASLLAPQAARGLSISVGAHTCRLAAKSFASNAHALIVL